VDWLAELRSLGLSPALLRLASDDLPHPEFEFRCGPVYRFFSLAPADYRPANFVPLWECDSTVVGCRRGAAGPEFLTWQTDEVGEPELLASSESGLLFWLFSYLIEDQDWDDEPAAREALTGAAVAVGFAGLAEVEAFQQEFGRRVEYARLLRAAAQQRHAEPSAAPDPARDNNSGSS
jgi:hypothetical protein